MEDSTSRSSQMIKRASPEKYPRLDPIRNDRTNAAPARLSMILQLFQWRKGGALGVMFCNTVQIRWTYYLLLEVYEYLAKESESLHCCDRTRCVEVTWASPVQCCSPRNEKTIGAAAMSRGSTVFVQRVGFPGIGYNRPMLYKAGMPPLPPPSWHAPSPSSSKSPPPVECRSLAQHHKSRD